MSPTISEDIAHHLPAIGLGDGSSLVQEYFKELPKLQINNLFLLDSPDIRVRKNSIFNSPKVATTGKRNKILPGDMHPVSFADF